MRKTAIPRVSRLSTRTAAWRAASMSRPLHRSPIRWCTPDFTRTADTGKSLRRCAADAHWTAGSDNIRAASRARSASHSSWRSCADSIRRPPGEALHRVDPVVHGVPVHAQRAGGGRPVSVVLKKGGQRPRQLGAGPVGRVQRPEHRVSVACRVCGPTALSSNRLLAISSGMHVPAP